MFRATAGKVIVFAFTPADGLPKTGDAGQITAYLSKDFGSVTVLGDTSATEMDATNAPGYYLFDVTGTEATCDIALISGKSSTGGVKVIGAPAVIYTRAVNAGLQSIDSNGRLDVIKLAGTTCTARDIGASVLLSSGTGTGQVSISSGLLRLSPTGVDDIYDEATSGHTTAGTYGDKFGAHLPAILKGLTTSGSTTTAIVMNATTGLDGGVPSATDDFYNGCVLIFTSGALAGQRTNVTDYVGSTQTLTVTALTGSAVSGVTFILV